MRRTSTPSFARLSARARTPWPSNATRTMPPDAAAEAGVSETMSKEDGASRPSRCSATVRMSPDTGSPSDEPLLTEELRELLRLIFHRAGHDLRMALRDRWGESADAERVGQRNRGGRDLPDRLSRGLHDRRQRRIPRRVRPELNRQEGGERDGVDALQTALELGRDLEDAVLDLDARDDAGMGQAGEPGDQPPRRRADLVVRLDAGQNEVVRQRAHGRGEEPRDGPDIVGPGIFGRDSDRLVGAFRERLPQHLIDPLRPQAEGDDATAVLFLEPNRLLEAVLVGAVDLVVQRVPTDVFPVRGNLELEIRVRDLLQANDDVQGHGGRATRRTLFNRVPRCAKRWSTCHSNRSTRPTISGSISRCSRTFRSRAPQDVDLLAPRARDPPATRGDAGTHRVLAPSQIASPSILDPFRLGRASLRRGVWPRRAVRAAGPATPVRSPTGKCRATCTLRRRG